MIQTTLQFLPDASRLARQQALILDRLRKGPATTAELNAICTRFGARLLELRRAGHDIVTSKKGGIAQYELREAP